MPEQPENFSESVDWLYLRVYNIMIADGAPSESARNYIYMIRRIAASEATNKLFQWRDTIEL